MTEKQRLDPIDWFASACFAILAGAAALALAVHLIQSIWLSLTLLLGGIAVIVGLVVGAIWWHRRQQW